MARDSAIWLLNRACRRIGIEGASSHSFRRTALTQMSNAGIPLRIIQEISGHRTLDELYKYLEVTEDQVLGAISSLSMLTPAQRSSDKSWFSRPVLVFGVEYHAYVGQHAFPLNHNLYQ